LFTSLYLHHPVGGLLVWATESRTAAHRGDGPLAAGVVKVLLDGQQHITSLYRVVRGRPPRFFDGNARVFTSSQFHLDTETFAFYQPIKMRGDQLWIDVTELMQKGTEGLGESVTRLAAQPELAANVGAYVGRLSRLLGINDVDLQVELFATKDDCRNPSELIWIDDGLAYLAQMIMKLEFRSIAIPPLGCGLDGLDWNEVRPLIEQHLDGLYAQMLVSDPGRSRR
jgi:hypothetical protein